MSYEYGIIRPLEELTIQTSRFDERRNYISLSRIYLQPEILVDEFLKGRTANRKEKLKCYKGYQFEDDLLKRLKIVYPDDLKTGTELSIEDGLFKGHPDFEFKSYPGDCKSLNRDDYMPWDHRISPKHFYQIQAYMMYSGKDKGYILYESQESGTLLCLSFQANERVQKNISERIIQIKQLLKDSGYFHLAADEIL